MEFLTLRTGKRLEEHGATEHVANAGGLLGFARLVSGDFELAAQDSDIEGSMELIEDLQSGGSAGSRIPRSS